AAAIAIGVDNVAAVTIDKQLRIIVLIGGQLAFPGANAVAAFIPFGGAGLLSFHLQAQVSKVEQVAVFKTFGGDAIGGAGRAVYDGSNTNDLSASFAQRGDGSQRRVAGGGRIFNDQDFLPDDIRAFNTALHAVLLGFLADYKSSQNEAVRQPCSRGKTGRQQCQA